MNDPEPKPEPKKEFDCLEFKRHVQEEIYEEIKDLTHEEEIEYFRRTSEEGPLGEWWKSVKRHSAVVREKPSDRYGK